MKKVAFLTLCIFYLVFSSSPNAYSRHICLLRPCETAMLCFFFFWPKGLPFFSYGLFRAPSVHEQEPANYPKNAQKVFQMFGHRHDQCLLTVT